MPASGMHKASSQPTAAQKLQLRSCACSWGEDCRAMQREQPPKYANLCVMVGRDRARAEEVLGCSQLELLPEKQKELADRSCGERKPDSLRGATVQYIAGKEPKDVRIWAGHFLDDDLIHGDDGLPIGVKAETAHEHYVVQPRSGPQPAQVPGRPRKGRDAAMSRTSVRAQRQ